MAILKQYPNQRRSRYSALLLLLPLSFWLASAQGREDKKKTTEPHKVRRVTHGLGLQSVGPLSPDKKSVLLVGKKPEQAPNLYVMDVADFSIRPPLTKFAWGVADPAWSPDGTIVAVAGFSESASFSDIYLVDVGTASLRQLTRNNFTDNQPVFLPDGKRLLFTTDESPLPDAAFGIPHVALLQIGKTKGEWFTEDELSTVEPGLSDDQKSVLLVRVEEGSGRHSLWQYGLDGKPLRNLTGHRFARIHRYVLNGPGGSIVVWAQEQAEQQEFIYLVDPKTGNVSELPDSDTPKGNPAVSPDGKLIAYIAPTSGGNHLYLFDSATQEIKQLSQQGGRTFSPMFISNTSILFGSDRDKEYDLYLVDLAAQPDEEEKDKKKK